MTEWLFHLRHRGVLPPTAQVVPMSDPPEYDSSGEYTEAFQRYAAERAPFEPPPEQWQAVPWLLDGRCTLYVLRYPTEAFESLEAFCAFTMVNASVSQFLAAHGPRHADLEFYHPTLEPPTGPPTRTRPSEVQEGCTFLAVEVRSLLRRSSGLRPVDWLTGLQWASARMSGDPDFGIDVLGRTDRGWVWLAVSSDDMGPEDLDMPPAELHRPPSLFPD